MNMSDLTEKVEKWAMARDLHTADPYKQMLKLMEEVGELSSSLARGNIDGVKDGLGDIQVVVDVLSMQLGTTSKECKQIAYDEIKYRKGKMVNGVYVKESDLKGT